MPKATVIGKADEGNLQVRLDEGSGDRKTPRIERDRPEFQRSRVLGACRMSAPLLLYGSGFGYLSSEGALESSEVGKNRGSVR